MTRVADDPPFHPTRLALDMMRCAAVVLEQRETVLRELVESASTFESAGFVLDPTLYRDAMYSAVYRSNIQMAKDALAFVAAARRWFEAQGVPFGAGAARGPEKCEAVFGEGHGQNKYGAPDLWVLPLPSGDQPNERS